MCRLVLNTLTNKVRRYSECVDDDYELPESVLEVLNLCTLKALLMIIGNLLDLDVIKFPVDVANCDDVKALPNLHLWLAPSD